MSTLYNRAMKIEQLNAYLAQRLDYESFRSIDSSLNGLQFSSPNKEVTKVVCAVDASLATFEAAALWGSDAIFVHHGLFWGKPIALTDTHYKRVEVLFKNNISLMAAHLPLDGHPELGNNATMAKLLNLEDIKPFGNYHGLSIGFQGTFREAVTIDYITEKLRLGDKTGLHVLPFGKKEIKSIGIVSGGAPNELLEAISLNLDAFVTGETSHTMYSYALESKINMISGGHYATEVFGVLQVGKELREKFGLEVKFIDLPTSL